MLERRTILLDEPPHAFDVPFAVPRFAASARFDPISEAVRQSGHERIRIELHTLAGRGDPPFYPPIWGLVSITNNATQQVTTIVPHTR